MKPTQFIQVLSLLGTTLALSVMSVKAMAAPYCQEPTTWKMAMPGTLEINPDAPLGSNLWKEIVRGRAISGRPCKSGVYFIVMQGTRPLLDYRTYDSGIPGIGLRIRIPSSCYMGYWPGRCELNNWAGGSGAYLLEISLVKVGPITTGGELTGTFGEQRIIGEQRAIYMWDGSVEISLRKPTCSVSSAFIDVPLGQFSTKAFTGIGSTTASQNFNIELQCSGGDAGSTLKVHTTLTDATNETNVSNVLSLSRDSQASGVGIQILNDATVLDLGPNAKWHAGNVQHGESTFTIPLSARYVQTADNITPGTANGNATFTMSYQ